MFDGNHFLRSPEKRQQRFQNRTNKQTHNSNPLPPRTLAPPQANLTAFNPVATIQVIRTQPILQGLKVYCFRRSSYRAQTRLENMQIF